MYVNIHDKYMSIYVDTTIYFTHVYAYIDGIFCRTEAEPRVALWLYSHLLAFFHQSHHGNIFHEKLRSRPGHLMLLCLLLG